MRVLNNMKTGYRSFFIKLLLSLPVIFCLAALLPMRGYAQDLDEISYYSVLVKVNEDATLDMTYSITWKVLDSTTEGPLTWEKIGVPNQHISNIEPLSDCIKSISYYNVGGSYVRIDLDREYKKGEIVTMKFRFTQDYMYQMDMKKEGETVYQFTPGWFDDIKVDTLGIYWADGKVIDASPADYETHPGCYVWYTSLDKGEKYTVSVTYPNDAFAFDESKKIKKSIYIPEFMTRPAFIFFAIAVGLGVGCFILDYFICLFKWMASAGFKSRKKIVRTILEYDKKCPNGGAARPEGKKACPYCGTNLIKKKTKCIRNITK